ncbi:MAG: methyltransferase domain-containing protein [Pseudonocardiaceae bacterium]
MTQATKVSDWGWRATALAVALTETDMRIDPCWRAAIEQTPRHLFVPRFYRDDNTVVDGADPATVGEWLDAVYSDTSLVVQCATAPRTDLPFPTSSSTMPSLMVRMLALLNVIGGSRVLEIGTATGYNAALLCHRLGAGHVASIELHPGLAADAADHLHSLGYEPTLAVGDGAGGIPNRAPYDRILATCAVPAIPPAWIDQLAPGGRIVTDFRGELASSLTVLDKIAPDTVQGRLLDLPGHFMWLRPTPEDPLPNADRFNLVINLDDAETIGTDLDPRILDEPGLRVLLSIVEPHLGPITHTQRETHDIWWLRADHCWAEITTGAHTTITHGGPRNIWRTIERVAAEWQRSGRPGRGRYGLTATADGTHHYWLDRPDRLLLTGFAGPTGGRLHSCLEGQEPDAG